MAKFILINNEIINTDFIESICIDEHSSDYAGKNSYSVFVYTNKASYLVFTTSDKGKAEAYLMKVSDDLNAITVGVWLNTIF